MRKRWSRIFALSMGIPLLLAMLAACGGTGTSTGTGGGNSSTTTGTIKVATEFPVSGADLSSGKPAEDGAHMAVDEANAAKTIPGYNLVFVPKNDVGASGAHDPTVGVKNVTDLIGDAQVAGIVGPFNSSVAKAEMPVANRAPITLISPSNTNQCLTKEGAAIGCVGANDLISTVRPTGKVTYFRIAATDDLQGAAAADYFYKTKGLKTVYVVDDTETYGAGIAGTFITEWQKIGGKVLGHDSIKSTTDYTGELAKIAAAKPDVVYFGGNDSTGGTPFRKQMATTAGLTKTPIGAGDGVRTGAFAQTIGTTSGGPVYATVAAVDPSKVPAAATFATNYQAKYGQLGAYSGGAYDCMKILIQAIKKAIDGGAKPPTDSGQADAATTFRQAVIDAMKTVKYSGITGTHSFDANGDTTNKTVSLYQLADVNGKPDWKYVFEEVGGAS
ncbi:MAG: branched-chain amino acid ABC transporter substrate-binding protein [Ktedonobacteraceae bacterium]|nr:branched-chain amino acid ABC transporter substrate-binding protein [Ktedonobacteraceae bacterium]